MKFLLDECVDRRLLGALSEYEVTTVQKQGWSGIKNGALLALAEAEFDGFITVDRNLAFQQNVRNLRLSVIILSGHGTRYTDLLPLIPDLKVALDTIQPGSLIWIGLK